MKQMEDWAAVQRVYKQTGSKRETARLLGISRNTVKKLLDMKQEPSYQRSSYPSKIEQFKEQIIEWRCAPYEFNGTRIYRELKSRGYQANIIICLKREWHNQTLCSFYQICATSHILSIDEAGYFYGTQVFSI